MENPWVYSFFRLAFTDDELYEIISQITPNYYMYGTSKQGIARNFCNFHTLTFYEWLFSKNKESK